MWGEVNKIVGIGGLDRRNFEREKNPEEYFTWLKSDVYKFYSVYWRNPLYLGFS